MTQRTYKIETHYQDSTRAALYTWPGISAEPQDTPARKLCTGDWTTIVDILSVLGAIPRPGYARRPVLWFVR